MNVKFFYIRILLVAVTLPIGPAWCWILKTGSSIWKHNAKPATATKSMGLLSRAASASSDGDEQDDFVLQSETGGTSSDEEEQDDFWGIDDLEVLEGEGFDFDDGDGDSEEDWIPDAVKAQQRGPRPQYLTPANEVIAPESKNKAEKKQSQANQRIDQSRPSPYTEEEEELIEAMGGMYSSSQGKSYREDGFLGDSTLSEIAMDYSVPICYLADVLCMWGVPVPIDIHSRLGDLVTGEQAFALVEAVNSIDIGVIQDRYSNQNLLQVCEEWDIELKDAFEMSMKEGWNLPFGVRTNLRVEQEEELRRTFSSYYME